MPLLPDIERDPPVLGDPVLGDVHVGHDLEAGRDRRGDRPWGGRYVVQHPVDPVADAELGLRGLDVDVRGPLVQCLEDQQIDVADDRRFLGDRLDVVDPACRALDPSKPSDASMAMSAASPPLLNARPM